MQQSKKNANLYSALFCIVFGLAVVAASRSINPNSSDPLGPVRYPMTLGLLITVLGAMLLLPAFRDKGSDIRESGFAWRDYLPILEIIGLGIFYLAFMNILGFVITSSLMLIGCAWVLGERNPLKITLFAAATSILLYALFRLGLGILLAPIPILNI